jgi:FKBP-type peptidyl-prolyl cis-trans isomerase (trigger factor)
MTVDFWIDELYRKALKDEKLFPVAQGDIKEVVSQSPLKFIAHIEVLPTITIQESYKQISLTAKKAQVSASEVK